MNKNIDLIKILKDCPKGFKLYSHIVGYVTFGNINLKKFKHPIIVYDKEERELTFSKDGKYFADYDGECCLFPSKEQKDWSKFTAPWYKKEELVKPKFKVGDIIRHKETNKDDVYEISKVYDDSYAIVGFNWMIYMKYQDQYELVPNKFDPKNLIPFDKVLVRDSRLVSDSPSSWWRCQIFSFIEEEDKDYPYVCIGESYSYCIPYNDDTKHLVGTNKEEPEYYRY